MPNNIEALQKDLEAAAELEKDSTADSFKANSELTQEEKDILTEMRKDQAVVLVEESPDGQKLETAADDKLDKMDQRIAEIKDLVENRNPIKSINTGDIHQTIDDVKQESKSRVITAMKTFANSSGEQKSDDDYEALNNEAILAVQKEYPELVPTADQIGGDLPNTDAVIKKLKSRTLEDLASFLPKGFVEMFADEHEIETNNFKAKDRMIASLSYMMSAGPDMDYLNEYIDQQNMLMTVNQRLMKCYVDFMDVLKDRDKLSEIAKKAEEIVPPDTSIWGRCIKNDSRRVHNFFAQNTVIMHEYRDAYQKIMDEEYPLPPLPEVPEDGNMDEFRKAYNVYNGTVKVRAELQEQINECDQKAQVYQSVTDLVTLKELWEIMVNRYTTEKRRPTYAFIMKEAVSAVDRIRKCKQNLPFPSYDGSMTKTQDILDKYLREYPMVIAMYNDTVSHIQEAHPEETADSDVSAIRIEGYPDEVVAEYYSLLLVILYGRLTKRLSSRDSTKYDAIMLDSYFQCWCRLAGDVYTMSDVWHITKDFVKYCIDNFPNNKPEKGKK